MICGRDREIDFFKRLQQSPDGEFVAVYGRRRVGKTFLIREYFKAEMAFELIGRHNATLTEHLIDFSHALDKTRTKKSPPTDIPESWQEAFYQLIDCLESLPKKMNQKTVVFFDELPWLATPRSRFLSALEHFWNSWASKQSHIILIVCGSAASWIINKVIQDRGGLYNRVTRKLRLEPFSLGEAEAFLQSRKVRLDRKQVMELYMVFGGIPHYLKEIQPGRSAAQNIDDICFAEDGFLRNEFNNLFSALFKKPEKHESIVRALGKKRIGLSRDEIVSATNLPTGGSLTRVLTELEECGFISCSHPYGKRLKYGLYRLVDEFSLFYMVWVEKKKPSDWLKANSSPAWKSWSGYAFEALTLKHTYQIKCALGISGVESHEASWFSRPKSTTEKGAQIDLLIDRRDDCINLCEMKFAKHPFAIDKATAENIKQKKEAFITVNEVKKSIFLTIVTPYGLKENKWQQELMPSVVTADDLFKINSKGFL